MIPAHVLAEIEMWIKEKKYGNLILNFQSGHIWNFHRNESIKVFDKPTTPKS